MENKGIYIHIPFCRKKCNYCDFFLVTNLDLINIFIKSLIKEIQLSAKKLKDDKFDSIFFGGGTPSLLTAETIGLILNSIRTHLNISELSEVSIESNPEDFLIDKKKLSEFKDVGINRLSIGIESFINKELKFLSREHSFDNIEKVLTDAVKIFKNISIDLVYSLPSQKIDDILYNLNKAIEFNIPHISAYTLIYEPETILYKDLKQKKFIRNDDNYEFLLYNTLNDFLNNHNYEHYEVSNYAKPGYESRHNLKYWEYIDYIGFGPSSHSFYMGERWNNVNNIIKYINKLNKDTLPSENHKILTENESMLEYTMLGLRAKGIDVEKFNNLYKINFFEKFHTSIETLIEEKFAYLKNNRLMLTEKGYAVADEIVSRFF